MAEGIPSDALGNEMTDHLSRMQMLINTLLPPVSPSPSPNGRPTGTSSLLRFGIPTQESQFELGVNIVKPAMRLGLLLVGS